MTTNRFLAMALTAFGFVLGVPALANDSNGATVATSDESLAVYVVEQANAAQYLICVEADAAAAGRPCLVSTDTSTVALFTLDEGLNYVVVMQAEPATIELVSNMPDNPGVN